MACFCLTRVQCATTISRGPVKRDRNMGGQLFLVSTPIGDLGDITLRAKRVLSEVDLVVCEEMRVGATLLARLAISKPLAELNEHTEGIEIAPLVQRMTEGQDLALISDHGTPLVADPGGPLISEAVAAGIRVIPVPGASAIISALVASGLPGKRFRFVGQLPAKAELRRRALLLLKDVRETIVVIDAPYRLPALLNSIVQVLGESRNIVVACNLTLQDERLIRGNAGQVVKAFEKEPFKGEFVCVIQGEGTSAHSKRI